VLYDKRGKTTERRNYPQFLESIQLQAARLATKGVKKGERVLVAAPTSWTWLENWFGAVWLGAWPVAIAPGAGFGPSEAQIQKIEAAVEMLSATHVIGEGVLKEELNKVGAKKSASIAVTAEELATISASPVTKGFDADPSATAFLQLTSGSTGRQRAVMIAQRSALHNPVAMDFAAGGPDRLFGVLHCERPGHSPDSPRNLFGPSARLAGSAGTTWRSAHARSQLCVPGLRRARKAGRPGRRGSFQLEMRHDRR
jgi:acyl-CoA synthetase (AMP-forming)/AMP-acid ligase II